MFGKASKNYIILYLHKILHNRYMCYFNYFNIYVYVLKEVILFGLAMLPKEP